MSGELFDASTICRFRNRLVKAELDQKPLAFTNSQLEQRGLKVQGGCWATIASAAQSRQHPEGNGEQAQVIDNADAQARWVKKGQQAFLGYRGHTVVDSEGGEASRCCRR